MISRLTLRDFRNHEDALIVPCAQSIVLVGDNGAGKTNVLEAVSLLSPGRGLRGASLATMARQEGAGGFGVAALVDDIMMGTGTTADAPDRRVVRIGGVPSAASSLAEHLAIVWLTPAMDRLFMESAGGRRRFLDRLTLGLYPAHAVHSNRYEAAMRSRNKLLSEGRGADPQWLDALESQMDEHGCAIAKARDDIVQRLSAILVEDGKSAFARPIITMAGWAYDRDRPLAEELKQGRGRDVAAGRTLSGPHRSDLSVVHAGNDQAAALCSTGEQKALLLSILLSHAALIASARTTPPLLLLDEVAAHLDPVRRGALFERLRATGSQLWLTGTEQGMFAGLGDATYLAITGGRVESANRVTF